VIISIHSNTQDGRYTVDDSLNITATLSTEVLEGSSMMVTLETGDIVELIASSNGTKLVGSYQPSFGDTSDSLAVEAVFETSGGVITIFGQFMSTFDLPVGQNLSDNSSLIIDTTPPLTIIESADYNRGNNTISLKGDKFTGAGSVGSDIKSQLDWTRFVWDLDSDPSDLGVEFDQSDILRVIIKSNTELLIRLTDEKAAELEGATGFVVDGSIASDLDDQLDISAGFIRDLAGNAAATDVAPNINLTYLDLIDLSGTVLSRGGGRMPDVYITGDVVEGDENPIVKSSVDARFVLEVDDGIDLTVFGDLAYTNTSPKKAITAQDALDALRLAVGLETTSGSKDAFSYIAADFNQSGKVTAQDALEILKYAAGLEGQDAEWKFFDSDGDYSGISRSNTNFDEGITAQNIATNLDMSMTGILVGDVNDTFTSYLEVM